MNVNHKCFSLSESPDDGADLVVIVVVGNLGVGTVLGSLVDFAVHVKSCSEIIYILFHSTSLRRVRWFS
jgi:hypothetical protein